MARRWCQRIMIASASFACPSAQRTPMAGCPRSRPVSRPVMPGAPSRCFRGSSPSTGRASQSWKPRLWSKVAHRFTVLASPDSAEQRMERDGIDAGVSAGGRGHAIATTATARRADRHGLRTLGRSAVLRASATLHLDAGARALALLRGASVRVMNMHGTPRRAASALEAQLRWARERFEILRPEAFLGLLDGRELPPRRPALVFTFDDGLASNAEVAAPILEALGMRAFFFVNPAFAVTRGGEARRFFTTRIRPVPDPSVLAAED